MFKNFMRIFSPKYFARLSRNCRASVASLSPQNYGKFTMQNICDTRTNIVRVLQDGRATVLRKHAKTSRLSGEKIKLSDIRTTVVQIKMIISYIREKVVRHSHECCATGARQSRDIFSKLDRNL